MNKCGNSEFFAIFLYFDQNQSVSLGNVKLFQENSRLARETKHTHTLAFTSGLIKK